MKQKRTWKIKVSSLQDRDLLYSRSGHAAPPFRMATYDPSTGFTDRICSSEPGRPVAMCQSLTDKLLLKTRPKRPADVETRPHTRTPDDKKEKEPTKKSSGQTVASIIKLQTGPCMLIKFQVRHRVSWWAVGKRVNKLLGARWRRAWQSGWPLYWERNDLSIL